MTTEVAPISVHILNSLTVQAEYNTGARIFTVMAERVTGGKWMLSFWIAKSTGWLISSRTGAEPVSENMYTVYKQEIDMVLAACIQGTQQDTVRSGATFEVSSFDPWLRHHLLGQWSLEKCLPFEVSLVDETRPKGIFGRVLKALA